MLISQVLVPTIVFHDSNNKNGERVIFVVRSGLVGVRQVMRSELGT